MRVHNSSYIPDMSNIMSALVKYDKTINIAGMLLIYAYTAPSSLVGKVFTLGTGYVVSKLCLTLTDMALIYFQTSQLIKYRTNSSICHQYEFEDLVTVFNTAFTKVLRDNPGLIEKLGNYNEYELKEALWRLIHLGFSHGEVTEILRILKPLPGISTDSLLNVIIFENVIIYQIKEYLSLSASDDGHHSMQTYFEPSAPLEMYNAQFSNHFVGEIGKLIMQFPGEKFSLGNKPIFGGHVIALQCNSSGKYRFYDGNIALPKSLRGFYQYDSKEALLSGLRKHILAFYQGSVQMQFFSA